MIYKLGMNVEINKTLGSPHMSIVLDSVAEVECGELGQGGIYQVWDSQHKDGK